MRTDVSINTVSYIVKPSSNVFIGLDMAGLKLSYNNTSQNVKTNNLERITADKRFPMNPRRDIPVWKKIIIRSQT